MSGPTLGALFVHPLKSARARAVFTAVVEPRGLRGDRRWMLVDAAGRFLSQRTHPVLARLDASLEGDTLLLAWDGREEHVVPPPVGGVRMPVVVWDDTVQALAGCPEADAWLTGRLGAPVRLVFMDDAARRPVSRGPDSEVSFADGYPCLLAVAESLDDLNTRIVAGGGAPVGMDRFRPNLVVRGVAPWAEDGWRRLRIGEVEFACVKPCERCVVTTTDQRTGARGTEPLRTLATFRRAERGVLFGINLTPLGSGELHVGDPVELLD
jgi:hypothetical protein